MLRRRLFRLGGPALCALLAAALPTPPYAIVTVDESGPQPVWTLRGTYATRGAACADLDQVAGGRVVSLADATCSDGPMQTGPNNGTDFSNSDPGGTGPLAAWANPAQAQFSDDGRSTAEVSAADPLTDSLIARAFFTAGDIPANAAITGLKLEIERQGSASVADYYVRLVINSVHAGDNKAAAGNWPAGDEVATYGGPGDTWGFALTRAQLISPTTGVAIRAQHVSGASAIARIDHVRMTVYFDADFPAIESAVTDKTAPAGTSHPVTIPAGTGRPHLWIALRDAPTLSGLPAGWTQRSRTVQSSNNVVLEHWEWTGAGDPTGFSLTSSVAKERISRTYRVVGQHATTASESSGVSGSSATPNPPNLDPAGWGMENTLWWAVCANAQSTTASAWPLADNQFTDQSSANGSPAVGLAVCTIGEAVASKDPGTFTIATSRAWVAATGATRPAAAASSALFLRRRPHPALLAQ